MSFRNDIPLRTPEGDYQAPWYRRNAWQLGLLAAILIIFPAVVLGVTLIGDTEQPTRYNVRTVIPESLPLDVDDGDVAFDLDSVGSVVMHDFVLTNRADGSLSIHVELLGQTACGASPPNCTGGAPRCGDFMMRGGPDSDVVSCKLEAIGQSSASIDVPPAASVILRMTLTNLTGAKSGTERLLILLSRR
jgi:hypothetical protein